MMRMWLSKALLVNNYTLEDKCSVLMKLDDDSQDLPMKEFVYKYCILIYFQGFDCKKLYLKQLYNYWAIQEIFKECDSVGMIKDYYKLNPKDVGRLSSRFIKMMSSS